MTFKKYRNLETGEIVEARVDGVSAAIRRNNKKEIGRTS